jgi:putative endonuclease
VAPACAGRKWYMFYVYVIKSIIKNWIYIGNTNNIEKRLNEHNTGLVRSTKAYKPFKLLFVQILDNRINARDLEKYLKVRWNKESLLHIINQ